MGQALDILREKVLLINERPHLIFDESFMMNIFSRLMYLLLFKEYFKFIFTKQRMSAVAQRSGA
jgi:hypothetical protein